MRPVNLRRQVNSPVTSLAVPFFSDCFRFERNAADRFDLPCDKRLLLHQFFEAEASKRPDAVAVIFEGACLTYRELNRRANQLARLLRNFGVVPDMLVGIAVEHSLDMAIAILGVMKAGAAYLPLDPAYPAERLTYMIEEAKLAIVLTQHHLLSQLPQCASRFWCLDSNWCEADSFLDSNLCAPVDPKDLAYCIFTSGSTGRPKGVLVPHAAIVSTLQYFIKYINFNADDCSVLLSSFSFDVSLTEFWPPLMVGGRCVMARPGAAHDPATLFEDLIAQQVTILHCVPSLLAALQASLQFTKLPSLRHVFCGGEALSTQLRDKFISNCNAELHNAYGSTETAVHAAFWHCDRNLNEAIIPIGRAIAPATIKILDDGLRPVQVGELGEVFVGGSGLARGYLNQPGLTAERFVPDPFGQNGERVYRTGDLGRLRADGTSEYIGRVDHQVKIRGFRIELAEIEAKLLTYPDVKETVVLAHEDHPDDKRLIAYITTKKGADIPVATLHAHLAGTLPQYMIPAAFVRLNALPLGPNGKLDRDALPAPTDKAYVTQTYEAPIGPMEIAIADLWEELLHVQRVGRNDKFFELGGNSLLALRFVSMLEHELKQKVSPAAIFEASTPASLVSLISKYRDQVECNYIFPLTAPGSGTPLFCMHGEDGGLGDYVYLLRWLKQGQPVFGVRLGSFKALQSKLTLRQICSSYVEEICKLHPRGPYLLCGYSFGGIVAYEVARQIHESKAEVLLILIDSFPISSWRELLFWPSVVLGIVRGGTFLSAVRRRRERNWGPAPRPDPGYESRQRKLFQKARLHKYESYFGSSVLIQCVASNNELALLNFDGLNGWASILKGTVETRKVRGVHSRFLKDSSVENVAQHLNEILNNVRRQHL
jgi:amino acid adenylation domain-containing protein